MPPVGWSEWSSLIRRPISQSQRGIKLTSKDQRLRGLARPAATSAWTKSTRAIHHSRFAVGNRHPGEIEGTRCSRRAAGSAKTLSTYAQKLADLGVQKRRIR